MSIFRSVRTVANASGDGPVDWDAVAEAAKEATDPGSIDVDEEERDGYARDVRDARDRISEVAALQFQLPETVEIHNRHHWIDANVATFRRLMKPLEEQATVMPGLARVANTGSMSFALAFLGRQVLGQYDPLLLADAGPDEHGLYFVRPNIVRVAGELDADYERFRRWIAFHEVTHAAEFGAAPWLPEHLETEMERVVESMSDGLTVPDVSELNATMTVVEGYAELLMDEAFDEEYDDLRQKLDRRRSGGDPFTKLIRRLLGMGMKRRQYERGKEFFEAVAERRGIQAAGAVWKGPEYLPSDEELDDPGAWIERIDP